MSKLKKIIWKITKIEYALKIIIPISILIALVIAEILSWIEKN